MISARRHSVLSLALAFSLLACQAVRADVTLQVNLGGDLAVADGTVGVLVVDRTGNGFLSPDHASVAGTVLAAGEQIGLSDDVIIGVAQSSSGSFSGGSGFVGVLAGIDYDALQLAPGMKMTFYWFPGISTPGALVPASANYESFRTESASNVVDSITFILPADRGVFDLAYLDAGNGGNISLTNPGGGGEHSTGSAGTDPTPIPSGGESPIDPVSTLPPVPGLTDIDWMTDAPGTYHGLIIGAGDRISGEIAVKVSPTGAMSSTITLGGKRYRHAGILTLPAAELIGAMIPRTKTGEPDLVLDLALHESPTSGGYSLVGALDDDGTMLDIVAAHNPSKRGVNFDEAGLYTFAIPAPGGFDQTVLPAGDGVGTIKVSSKGSVSALITLGDGTRASERGYLSLDQGWNLYVPLYKRKGEGFLAGSVSLREIDNIADFDSPLHWKKGPEPKPSAKSFYPLGFETSANLVGSRFDIPRKGTPLLSQLIDGPDNAMLMLEGGDLDPVVGPKDLTWSMANRVTHDGSANGEKISIKPSTKNGQVKGSFTKTYLDGNNKKVTQKVAFVGVALQKQGVIVGNFKGKNQLTGLMTIESADLPTLTVRDDDAIVIANGGTLDFGDTGIDGPGGERIVEIANDGTGNLYIDGYPMVDDPSFGLSVRRMGFLSPAESTRLRVRFVPGAIASSTGTLTIYTNDRTANPFVINLTGNGVAGTDSDYESGDDRDHQIGVPGAPWIPDTFTSASFDVVESIGTFGGNLDVDGAIVAEQVGIGTVKVSASGAFSASLKIGRDVGKVAGIINPEGSVTSPSFSGKLAAKYALGALTLVENTSGNFALAGTLTPIGDGDDVSFLFGHNKYSKTNPVDPAIAGRYTMVIPANEDLGAGYPAGDGVALVNVKTDGAISAALVMADGERASIKGKLTDEDIWQIYAAWKTASLGGQVVFRDLAGVSDFDGTVRWNRPANPKAKNFHEGFNVETAALGSHYVRPPLGDRMVGGFANTADNAVFIIDGNVPPIGERTATWSELNKITVIPLDTTERIAAKATGTTGSVVGSVSRTYDDDGILRKETVKCTSVVFQKQDLVTGSWQAGKKAGFFGITTPE